MLYLDNILFFIILCMSFGLFIKNMRKVYQNISLGQEVPYLEKKKKERWILVLKTALGQGRMNKKPLVGFLCLYWIFYYQFRII